MKLSEYVTQVLNDPKYGRDPEWVRLNLSREHIERIEAAHDAEVRAAERERIIQDMQKRSHPDDWGVPCVYVESYAEHLRGEKR